MPWHTQTPMSQRFDFVVLATRSGLAFSELCRRFGVSRKTGYKWLKRFKSEGQAALVDRSRRPRCSPRLVPPAVTEAVVALRKETTWGGRKLRRRLELTGFTPLPAASTCTEILRRADLLNKDAPRGPVQRFERALPNALWQMDHKGDFPLQSGQRCHALTVLDDHSRFNLVLDAADNQRTATVQAALTTAFAHYGLPEAILCDNGATWRDLPHCAKEFARFRQRYNHERPHDSVGNNPPASRYRPSVRPLPAQLPALEYDNMEVRVVRAKGAITFRNQTWAIGQAFASLPIGLRPSPQADGQWEAFFSFFRLGILDFTTLAPSRSTVRRLSSPRSPKD